MTLHFIRNEEDRILRRAVMGAFSSVAEKGEPGSDAARAASAAVVASQGLVQPICMDGRVEGLTLEEATAIVETAGYAQLSHPLAEAMLAATVLADAGAEPDPGLSSGSPVTHVVSDETDIPASAHLAVILGDPDADHAAAALVRCTPDSAERPGAFDLSGHAPRVPGERAAVIGEHVACGADLRPVFWTLMAADMLGAAQMLFDRSLGYLGERSQFGQPLSSYQALRHRAADDWMLLEDMRAAVDHAAALFDGGAEAASVRDAARIAKATASELAPVVAENAIQFHGAAGFTWEFGLHFALRRIKALSLLQGTAARHHRRLGESYLARLAGQ